MNIYSLGQSKLYGRTFFNDSTSVHDGLAGVTFTSTPRRSTSNLEIRYNMFLSLTRFLTQLLPERAIESGGEFGAVAENRHFVSKAMRIQGLFNGADTSVHHV